LEFTVALNRMIICALIMSMGYRLLKYKSWRSIQNIGVGLLLGVLNFANIAFYVKASMLLKDSPPIVLAGMNILVVVLRVIAGVMFFNERLKPASAAGLLLGLTSVICLAYAMSAWHKKMQIQSDVAAGRLLRPVQGINRPVGSRDSAHNGAVD